MDSLSHISLESHGSQDATPPPPYVKFPSSSLSGGNFGGVLPLLTRETPVTPNILNTQGKGKKSETRGQDSLEDEQLWMGLPPSAKDLLNTPKDIPYHESPAALELELVCTCCFNFASECECLSRHATTVLLMSHMPWTTKPYGSFQVPEWLAGVVGMKAAHIAAGVAHHLWPVMSLGIIPIFDKDSLVLVRSRALLRCPDSREFMRQVLGPIKQSQTELCTCGCEEAICGRVAIRHNLYTIPGALERAQSTTYSIGEGDKLQLSTVVTMDYGLACVSKRGYGLIDVNIDSLEDFILTSTLDEFQNYHGNNRHWSDNISWDAILESWILRIMLRSGLGSFGSQFYNFLTKKYHQNRLGRHLVFRSECLGTGNGLLVMDLPRSPGSDYPCMPCVSQLAIATSAANQLMKLSDIQERGQNRDCTTPLTGQNWEHLTLDGTLDPHPSFTYTNPLREPNIGPKFRSRVGIGARARPGFPCTMECKDGVQAYCCGFTSPRHDITETTVYIVGLNSSVAFLAIAQYAQMLQKRLYLVSRKCCLGCTVLQASPGSIVAGILPDVNLEVYQSNFQDMAPCSKDEF